ncbi:GntR family transcriptional regulator [Campylobacter coli]|nr:GntR family transcriptional regulator [Campylobacter coli]
MSKTSQKNSSYKIYEFIIDSIIEGNLKPNDRIKEQDIVQKTGFSRTPIREALGLLQNDGILIQDSKKGLVVARLDLISITKLYEIRELLESEAAKLAAQYASSSEIEILENIVQAQKNITELNELKSNNVLFHQTLYRCSGNHYLYKIMENLDRSLLLLGDSTLAKENRAKEAYKEHLAVVEAIRNRDIAKAEEMAKFHIRQAYKVRLSNILNQS